MSLSAQVPMREAHEETQAQLAQLEDVQGRQVEQKFKSGMEHKLLKERHEVRGWEQDGTTEIGLKED